MAEPRAAVARATAAAAVRAAENPVAPKVWPMRPLTEMPMAVKLAATGGRLQAPTCR